MVWVFRIGDELGVDNKVGLVNQLYSQANNGSSSELPLFDSGTRSVTHISDVCEAVIMLLEQADSPDTINIPGDTLTIAEIAN